MNSIPYAADLRMMQQMNRRMYEEQHSGENSTARNARILKVEFTAACETYYRHIMGAVKYTIDHVKTQWGFIETSAPLMLEYEDIENGYVHLGQGVGRFTWHELLQGHNPRCETGDPSQNLFEVTGVIKPFERARDELAKLGYTLHLEARGGSFAFVLHWSG